MRTKLIAAFVALLLAPSYAEARCFLFICPAATHHFKHHQAEPSETPQQKPTMSPFCRGIERAFEKSETTPETFASSFPLDKQEQVLKCVKG